LSQVDFSLQGHIISLLIFPAVNDHIGFTDRDNAPYVHISREKTKQLISITDKGEFFVKLKKYEKPIFSISVGGLSASQGFQEFGVPFLPHFGNKKPFPYNREKLS
jgi:hypothetical protein